MKPSMSFMKCSLKLFLHWASCGSSFEAVTALCKISTNASRILSVSLLLSLGFILFLHHTLPVISIITLPIEVRMLLVRTHWSIRLLIIYWAGFAMVYWTGRRAIIYWLGLVVDGSWLVINWLWLIVDWSTI